MKSVILVALALVAVAVAVPVAEEPPKTLRSEFDLRADGYNFGFETENGINRQETGELKQVPDEENKPRDVVVVRGSYSYTDKDGNVETINYQADENGYVAEGPSVPKAVSRR